jgi:hypothetical protein
MQRRPQRFVNETADQHMLIHQTPRTGALSIRAEARSSNHATIGGSPQVEFSVPVSLLGFRS